MTYNVDVVKYEVVENTYAVYLIKIVGPNNISFHIQDRYSSILTWHNEIKKNIGTSDGLPSFPEKKYFGKLEPKFLERRKAGLKNFLNPFLNHPLVKSSPRVPTYFKMKATGKGSGEAVESLALYMSGGATPGTKTGTVGKKPAPKQESGTWQAGTAQQFGEPVDTVKPAASKSLTIAQLTCQIEFDHQKFQQQFESDCKQIVDEIQEKFIDLLGDAHSDYGDQI